LVVLTSPPTTSLAQMRSLPPRRWPTWPPHNPFNDKPATPSQLLH
jgi:hypothetical protein